ncbi:MAG: hypothetical protein Q9195_006791 [Heterodermia aff. obscurata]
MFLSEPNGPKPYSEHDHMVLGSKMFSSEPNGPKAARGLFPQPSENPPQRALPQPPTSTMPILLPPSLLPPTSTFATLIPALALLGTLSTFTLLWRLGTFTHTHYLRSSTFRRYLHSASGAPAWALVTGASDGVGHGFVEALAAAGFNVVLHGRDARKLHSVVTTLRAGFPSREFDVLVLDGGLASAWDNDGDGVVEARLRGRELRVLVNNLGGHGGAGDWLALA